MLSRGIDGVRVPGRPKFFFGRRAELSKLVDMALDPTGGNARIIIKGPPGIGKTTLATAILTDHHVKSAFGPSRFFIRCSELKGEDRSVDGLLRNLALKLRLPADGDVYDKVESKLGEFQRSIVVLDGLEAIWNSENSSAEIETERLLDLLSDIDEVVLIATVRGKAVPQNIPWTNRLDDPLTPLSPTDARTTFLARTDCKRAHDAAEKISLEALVNEVDHHPQAVVLLARLGDPPSKLLREWKAYDKRRTEMIEADDHDGTEPELSMCVSIMLSIQLLERNIWRPLDLLRTCQESQDGLTEEHQEELRSIIPRFDRQRRLLERPGLVQADDTGKLTVLSPIRYYHPPQ